MGQMWGKGREKIPVIISSGNTGEHLSCRQMYIHLQSKARFGGDVIIFFDNLPIYQAKTVGDSIFYGQDVCSLPFTGTS